MDAKHEPKVWLSLDNARSTAHEYRMLDPDLRPRATCGYRPKNWIQDLVPATSLNDIPYCPKRLAH